MYAVPELPEALNNSTVGSGGSATMPALVEGTLLVSPGTPGSKWPVSGREDAGEYWMVAAGTLREGSVRFIQRFQLFPSWWNLVQWFYSGTTVGSKPNNLN